MVPKYRRKKKGRENILEANRTQEQRGQKHQVIPVVNKGTSNRAFNLREGKRHSGFSTIEHGFP